MPEATEMNRGLQESRFFPLRGKDNAELFENSQSRSLGLPPPKVRQALTLGFSFSPPPSISAQSTPADSVARRPFTLRSPTHGINSNDCSDPDFLPSHNPSCTRIPGPCKGRLPSSPIRRHFNIKMVCPRESVSESYRHYASVAARYSDEVTKSIKVNTRTMRKVEPPVCFISLRNWTC